MPSDSGGTRKVSRFVALFTGCFGRKKRRVDHYKTPKTGRRIKLPARFFNANIKLKGKEKHNYSFIQQLSKEKLLAPGSSESENPIIDICLGFQNEELQYNGPKIYHTSYERSRWDRVLSGRKCREGIRELADATISCNEPIVDDLPASIWMECLEPTLAVLIALSAMKHRRTNLTSCKSIGRSVNSTIRDSRIHHGDFNFDPWNEMIGPLQVIHLNTIRRLTEEVRPSRLIDLTGSPLSIEYDVELNVQTTRRNQHRNNLTRPAQNPYNIEDDEPMAYTFQGESDSDYSMDSSDDENINQSASTNDEGPYPEIILSNQTMANNLDANQNSSNQLKMRTYLWREDYGKHWVSEPEEITIEEASDMQNHWLQYLKDVVEGTPTTEDADLLHSRLKDDPWNRRRFLKDAVLFLDDVDTQERIRRKQKRQRQLEVSREEISAECSSSSDFSITSSLTIDSISNISEELADMELGPLPTPPAKQLNLMMDDYVICNVVPRSFAPGSGTSVESLDSIESDPYESIKRICQPENTDKPKGVVMFTGTYYVPTPKKPAPKQKSIHQPKLTSHDVDTDTDMSSTSVLSVYSRRSHEDISI